MNNFSEALFTLRKSLGLTQTQMAAKLGLSMSYVHQLEAGKRTPSDAVETLVRMLQEQLAAGLIEKSGNEGSFSRATPPASSSTNRTIPVIGWAHAGEAASYEELPPSWQNEIPTECQDVKAFAVSLEGDSMEPRFGDGDLLIVQPSEQAYSGCYVVARFVNDGVIFRRLEMSGNQISLVPLNDRYQVTTHAPDEFSWIYPVWGRWTQLWKR